MAKTDLGIINPATGRGYTTSEFHALSNAERKVVTDIAININDTPFFSACGKVYTKGVVVDSLPKTDETVQKQKPELPASMYRCNY